MRFKYLKDPLFLACVLLYFINRWILKGLVPTGFFHSHMNALLCIPFWLPIMLFFQKKAGLRKSDDPPYAHEILLAVILWSWIFEILLPRVPFFYPYCFSDYKDILFYALGGLAAGLFWNWRYTQLHPRKLVTE
jgi:hypothetical protein